MISHSEIEIKPLEISNHQTFLSVLEKRQKIFIYTILDYQDSIKERFEIQSDSYNLGIILMTLLHGRIVGR